MFSCNFGAAYRNRTDDLRITRSPARRSRRPACTDRSTHVPECSQRTECSGLPVHDSVHGLGQTLGNRMLLGWTLMARDLGHRHAGPPTFKGLWQAPGSALTSVRAGAESARG